MFPDVRLMIAATLASIVALTFGFVVFAAFRVSHAPLERIPSTTPLQLVTANAAVSAAARAAADAFDRSLQNEGPAGGSGIAALTYSAPPAAERPATTTATMPAADDREPAAAELEQPPPERADAPMPAPQAAAPEAAQEKKSDEATTTTSAQAPPGAPSVAAVEVPSVAAVEAPSVAAVEAPSVPVVEAPSAVPPSEQAHPAAQTTEIEAPPPPAMGEPIQTMPETSDKAVEKDAKRSHAARTHHARKAPATAQDSIFGQSNFTTTPPWPWEVAEKQPTRSRRAKTTSSRQAASNPATGGPFVGAPSQ
jgi:hypothetical protein